MQEHSHNNGVVKLQIPIIRDPNELMAKMKERRKTKNTTALIFYNGFLNAAMDDPSLMMLPVDDRIVCRGHAIFETFVVIKGYLNNPAIHLARFMESAKKAQIHHSYTSDSLLKLVMHIFSLSKNQNCRMILWLSSGISNFSIQPPNDQEAYVYAIVLPYTPSHPKLLVKDESIISTELVPLKANLLATMKSTNYLLNSILSMEAQKRGGHFGLWMDGDELLEGSISALMIVTKNTWVLTSNSKNILRSCTATKAISLIENSIKFKEGICNGILFQCIRQSDLMQASEAFWLGGDFDVHPIISVDNIPIGTGVVGPVTTWLYEQLINAASKNTDHPILYDEHI